MNAIRIIKPYLWNGTWVFDDEAVGLVREPFVAGVPEMIDRMVQGIPGAQRGFVLTFSDAPFSGAQTRLDWVREEIGGNWYRWEVSGAEGWLCPAMFKYFGDAPASIYLRMDPAPAGESRPAEAAAAGGMIVVARSEAERLLELLEAGLVDEARELVRAALSLAPS